jgi:hypothetical protein
MVGRIGTDPMTGVSIVNSLLFVWNLCVFGGLSGIGIFTAQYYGKNDHEGVAKAGPGGHKEINRTNLSAEAIDRALETSVVRRQLAMLRWRATCPAFGFDSELEVEDDGSRLVFTWTNGGHTAKLQADLSDYSFVISENDRVLEL